MLYSYFAAQADAVVGARDKLAEETGCWPSDGVRGAEVPGWSFAEIYVGDRLPQSDDAQLMPLFDLLCDASAQG